MNCPGHVQIFNQGLRSYRDLPLRFCEFGKVHRYEPSGALHGLMRVRAFTQDDAHIFCHRGSVSTRAVEADQADARRSTATSASTTCGSSSRIGRPSASVAMRCGTRAEAALRRGRRAAGLEFTLNPGEGAFYGPKLEFVLRDAIGRDWQCGTLQVDLNMPGRLGATLHRRGRPEAHAGHAASGDVRLAGALYRHFDRALRGPAARPGSRRCRRSCMNITDEQAEYVQLEVTEILKNQGLRVEIRLAQREGRL